MAPAGVPLLVGETLGEARAQLERVGLVIGNVKEAPGGDAVGTITTQRLPRASAGLGTRIDLAVAAAAVAKPEIVRQPQKPRSETKVPQDPEVPPLIGLSSEVARDRIVRRGFIVGDVSVRPASKPETDLAPRIPPGHATASGHRNLAGDRRRAMTRHGTARRGRKDDLHADFL